MRVRIAAISLFIASVGPLLGQTCNPNDYLLTDLGVNSGLGTRNDFPYQGGTTRVAIIVPPGCTWGASGGPAWVQIIGPLTGTNSAIIEIGVEANTTTAERRADTALTALRIGGQGFFIRQAAAPAGCSFNLLSTLDPSVPADGVLGAQRRATQLSSVTPACVWGAYALRSWLELDPNAGGGPGSPAQTSIAYSVYPNFTPRQRSTVGVIANRYYTVQQAAATQAQLERLVRLLYFNFFGRLPAPNEVAVHVQRLNAGGDPGDLAYDFMTAKAPGQPYNEFQLGSRFIAGLYQGILGRTAEFTGWRFQRNAVSAGRERLQNLLRNFLNSAEYKLRFGTPNEDQFVTNLYRNILFRTPTAAEVKVHADALRGGTTNREALATAFLNSTEFRDRDIPELLAPLLYAVLLSRDGYPWEVDAREEQIRNGTPLRTIIKEIMSSAEFDGLYK